MFVVRLYVTLCDCDGRRQSETHCRLHIYASEPAVHAVCRVSGNYALTWSRVPKYLSTWVSRTPSGASANPHPLALLLLPLRLRSPGVFPAFVRFVSPLPLRDPPSPSPTPVRTRLHSTPLHSTPHCLRQTIALQVRRRPISVGGALVWGSAVPYLRPCQESSELLLHPPANCRRISSSTSTSTSHS